MLVLNLLLWEENLNFENKPEKKGCYGPFRRKNSSEAMSTSMEINEVLP